MRGRPSCSFRPSRTPTAWIPPRLGRPSKSWSPGLRTRRGSATRSPPRVRDVFVITAQLDFTGQVITPVVDFLPLTPASDPNPFDTNPPPPYQIQVQAIETQDFLGDLFVCVDPVTSANRVGTNVPGDILTAHMYTSVETILELASDPPRHSRLLPNHRSVQPLQQLPRLHSGQSERCPTRHRARRRVRPRRRCDGLRPRYRRSGPPVKGRTRIRAMKTTNKLRAFLGLGTLSLMTAAFGGATTGCVADRPSRNGVFDENQYIRKDWLIRDGDATNPDFPAGCSRRR